MIRSTISDLPSIAVGVAIGAHMARSKRFPHHVAIGLVIERDQLAAVDLAERLHREIRLVEHRQMRIGGIVLASDRTDHGAPGVHDRAAGPLQETGLVFCLAGLPALADALKYFLLRQAHGAFRGRSAGTGPFPRRREPPEG